MIWVCAEVRKNTECRSQFYPWFSTMPPSLSIDVSCSLMGFQSVWIKQDARVSAQVLCSLQMHVVRLSKSHTANLVVCSLHVSSPAQTTCQQRAEESTEQKHILSLEQGSNINSVLLLGLRKASLQHKACGHWGLHLCFRKNPRFSADPRMMQDHARSH